jgi:asparagine synthase (glutamine-hydrolysing)
MEMAHSVEGRVPFLDHHVVELASRLPVGMLIRGTVEKYVLRELARDVVTEAIHTRQKHPFFAPPVSDGPLGELMKDTLRSAAMDAVPFFDRNKIRGLIDALPQLPPATRVAMDAPLLLLLSCALLQRSFALGS